MKERSLNGKWALRCEEKGICAEAQVPGDIHADLFRAGVIDDPYFGLNHRSLRWVLGEDFVYETTFRAGQEERSAESAFLCFYGIDTYASVELNGVLLGETKNMFLRYDFDVTKLLRDENVLRVYMRSAARIAQSFDCGNYFATFNVPRIFMRKAQCHFGWDWAPDLPGYGIWNDVTLRYGSARRMERLRWYAYEDGAVNFRAELNFGGEDVYFRAEVALRPGASLAEGKTERTVAATGTKNLVNLYVPDRELWWPRGYGGQNLYEYRVGLYAADGTLLDECRGRLAFRTVEAEQHPFGEASVSFTLKVNGVRVYCRGSNWVPAECFTGTMKREKYERLIRLAAEGNFNMLRVWGGGIYERGLFYDLCDEYGIMVWQDFMFACADIPEEDAAFVENCLKEVDYQVDRLAGHPSIVFWCGGNEKTGSCGKMIQHGDYFVDTLLHGRVATLDATRPFLRQSPFSLTDNGNDRTSGESHCSSFEEALTRGMRNYRKAVAEKLTTFTSECAVLGPSVREQFERMFPADKLWPVNEYWEDRFMKNPYATFEFSFAKQEVRFAEELYGQARGLDDFIFKAMSVHAESLQAEADHSRCSAWKNSGFMNWMFSDIWPSGTWAVIDHSLQPKQAYYRLKRCYAPLRPAFAYGQGGETGAYVLNDTREDFAGRFVYGEKRMDGSFVWEKEEDVRIPAGGHVRIGDAPCAAGDYLYGELLCGGARVVKEIVSPTMWADTSFESDYTVRLRRDGRDLLADITANKFLKSLYLHFDRNYEYRYSDNFIDVEAGETVTVRISSAREIDPAALRFSDFAAQEG